MKILKFPHSIFVFIIPVLIILAAQHNIFAQPETNPELYKKSLKVAELEKKAHNLVRIYNQSNNNERKTELKNEIKNILSDLFELREEKYNLELKELENQIKFLKSKVSKRKENKEKIISKHLESLISSGESFDW